MSVVYLFHVLFYMQIIFLYHWPVLVISLKNLKILTQSILPTIFKIWNRYTFQNSSYFSVIYANTYIILYKFKKKCIAYILRRKQVHPYNRYILTWIIPNKLPHHKFIILTDALMHKQTNFSKVWFFC